MENEKQACECTLPRFWRRDLEVPEKLVQKINPVHFIEFMEEFMADLGNAIIKARMTGRGFILEASIRFPEFIALGENKGVLVTKEEDAE